MVSWFVGEPCLLPCFQVGESFDQIGLFEDVGTRGTEDVCFHFFGVRPMAIAIFRRHLQR